MQSPGQLAKINPKLSGTLRQQPTYLRRHKQKSRNNQSFTSSPSDQLSLQYPSVMSFPEVDFSKIKIQQQQGQWQVMRNQYIQTQLLWRKQIDQTRSQTNRIRQQTRSKEKAVRQMQRQLSTKRVRMAQVTQRLKRTQEELQGIVVQDHAHQIYLYNQQFQAMMVIGVKEVQQATQKRDAFIEKNQQVQTELAQLQLELQQMLEFQSQSFNDKLSTMLQQQQKLKNQIQWMQTQKIQTQNQLQKLQQKRPVSQQMHRRYLQLYQKIVVNRELDKVQGLVALKDKQIKRLQIYSQKRVQYNTEKMDIQKMGLKLIQKDQLIVKLEQDVRQKSTILLNLYQIQSQKMR